MIGLEPVKKFISLNIFSDYIKGERPISSFIVAEPEHGKTETLASFEDVQGVLMLLDVTAYGSATFIFSRILAKEVRRLIFPDFSRILARSRTVVDEVITMINAIVEDGINWAILTKNIQWIPIVKEKVYAGVTIAITPKCRSVGVQKSKLFVLKVRLRLAVLKSDTCCKLSLFVKCDFSRLIKSYLVEECEFLVSPSIICTLLNER